MTSYMVQTFVPSLHDPDLPGNMIVRELGGDFFKRLQEKLGGTSIKPPRNTAKLDDDHPLVMALGHEDACRLCKIMGGEEFYVARGWRRASPHMAEVVRGLRAGVPGAQIARALGISDRHVRNLKKQAAAFLDGPAAAPQ